MDSLHPPRHIHKVLLSAPCHFTGEFSSPELLLTHAWQSMGGKGPPEILDPRSPHYRSFFLFSFKTSEEEAKPKVGPVPHYEHVGNIACAFLSVLFGKYFNNHGFVETVGHFTVPWIEVSRPLKYKILPPYSDGPRKNLPVKLELNQFSMLAPLFVENETVNPSDFWIAYTASRFYLQALRFLEDQPDLAYLNLITAGEVLADSQTFTDPEIFDPGTLHLLDKVKTALGENDFSKIRERLFQIRKRFALTLQRLVCPGFFDVTECQHANGALKKDDFEKRLKAAYDLRSLYTHAGVEFGEWITIAAHHGYEIMPGEPVVQSKELKAALKDAPTFTGLERVLRCCILRFIHSKVLKLDPMFPAEHTKPAFPGAILGRM